MYHFVSRLQNSLIDAGECLKKLKKKIPQPNPLPGDCALTSLPPILLQRGPLARLWCPQPTVGRASHRRPVGQRHSACSSEMLPRSKYCRWLCHYPTESALQCLESHPDQSMISLNGRDGFTLWTSTAVSVFIKEEKKASAEAKVINLCINKCGPVLCLR